jgi:hypothetical protein
MFLRYLLILVSAVGTGAQRVDGQIPETGEKIRCIMPIRPITSGKAHWFGYYDKEAFDPMDRYVLAAEVDFEDRSPTADDAIRLGMVDTKEGDTWIPLGESNAWGWQQGCMLQWLPGTDSTADDEWRCDLHPRWNRDGNKIAIDAMYEYDRRQVYLLDVSRFTTAKEKL